MVFEKELKKLGLKDKEAAVYIACLQLGPSPVQQIARKAKVVRATTYVVLESLQHQGLATHYKDGKKTLYSAEPPGQLMRLLEKDREAIDEKQQELEGILPELQILMKAAGGKPSVRYFEGLEGLRSMRREMAMYSEPGDTWYNYTPVDHLDAVFGRSELLFTTQRVAKRIKGKTIFSTKSETLKKEMMTSASSQLTQRKYVSPRIFNSSSGMTIYGERIAIGTFTGKIGGVIIESKPMAEMMKSIFDLAWESLDTI